MQIYWNQRKFLRKERFNIQRIGLGHQHDRCILGTPIWRTWRHVKHSKNSFTVRHFRYHSSPELSELKSFKRWWKTNSLKNSRQDHTGERITGLTKWRSALSTTMRSCASGETCTECLTREGSLTISLQTKWVLICFILSTSSLLPRDKRSTSFGDFLGLTTREFWKSSWTFLLGT